MRVYYSYDPFWIIPFCFVMLIAIAIATTRPSVTGHNDNLARYEAREAEARADEARAKAWGRWADNMPFILLMGGVAGAGIVWTVYRGRVDVETIRAKRDVQPTHVTQNLTVNVLPDEAMRILQEYAASNNKRIQSRGADYYLIDNATGDVQRVRPKQITG